VIDEECNNIRLLSADLQQVSTVAGDGKEGHRDGAAVQAQFSCPSGLAVLPCGRVLVGDSHNHCIRMLSADLQHVSTVAGTSPQRNSGRGHRDGAAAQSMFAYPAGLAVLSDGRVLVSDYGSASIRLLSADLQNVSTVVSGTLHHQVQVGGAPSGGHRDGAVAQARFKWPLTPAVLPDGRVLVPDSHNCNIRLLSANLQEVSTYTLGDMSGICAIMHHSSDRVLISRSTIDPEKSAEAGHCIQVLEDFPSAQTCAWLRRRTLLMCLLTQPPPQRAPPAAAPVVTGVLLRMASLPRGLSRGPCIFRYL
jgi:hypothetical protein